MPVALPPTAVETVPAADARRLLLGSAGLLAEPDRRSGPRGIERTINELGFVQVDAIAVTARAHHHILMTRHDGYRPETLQRITERERRVFEHWTHDASLIRVDWYPAWQNRFQRARARGVTPNEWWKGRIGPRAAAVVRRVLAEIGERGPSPAAAVAEGGRAAEGGWWRWSPEKAALEYAWRAGLIAIAGRRDFTKLYDLAERVHPEHHDADPMTPSAHVDWAARAAIDRLVVATPAEIARFLEAIDVRTARAWAADAVRRGELVPVMVEPAGGGPLTAAVARPDWRERAAALPEAPDRARPLSPFDPAIRERPRAARVLGLEYRFEAFVPAPKRVHGYYVLPILDRERFVGRVDVKLDRPGRRLQILGHWWEPGVRATAAARRRTREGLDRYAAQCGADGLDGVRI